MARKQLFCMCIVGLLAAAVAGCGDKDKGMSMAGGGEHKAPQRPAEMDQLANWVGNWTFTGTCTMVGADKPMNMTGSSSANWAVDRWAIVETMEGPNMMGPGMFHGMVVYTYDAHDRVFKQAMMENMGGVSHGTMTPDGPNRWKTKGVGRNSVTGEKSTSDGWVRMIDSNTMEWGGTEYMNGKKFMEMKGTARRKM